MTTGVAGGDSRFQVLARLYNIDTHIGITLKADLDDVTPEVDSWVEHFRGADWHEREAWEMYGFNFVGHPGLRHLYLPSEFEGFPLRKDFPLLAREVKPWPGLVDVEPIPGGGDEAEPEEAPE
jgi:NADH-quinone oxidoreductase subunit C